MVGLTVRGASLSLAASLLVALAANAGCAQGGNTGDTDGGGGGGDAATHDAPSGPDGMTAMEVCNGIDDDGDQFVDEGTPEELCGTVMNGTPKCNGLAGCSIDACGPGFFNVDGPSRARPARRCATRATTSVSSPTATCRWR
jgi:hypothetical protein